MTIHSRKRHNAVRAHRAHWEADAERDQHTKQGIPSKSTARQIEAAAYRERFAAAQRKLEHGSVVELVKDGKLTEEGKRRGIKLP